MLGSEQLAELVCQWNCWLCHIRKLVNQEVVTAGIGSRVKLHLLDSHWEQKGCFMHYHHSPHLNQLLTWSFSKCIWLAEPTSFPEPKIQRNLGNIVFYSAVSAVHEVTLKRQKWNFSKSVYSTCHKYLLVWAELSTEGAEGYGEYSHALCTIHRIMT